MELNWSLKKFDDLFPAELYSLLRLRNEIFVVEQNCVFQDADNKDQDCYHLMGHHQGMLAAYSRIVPPDANNKLPSIGRVAVSIEARGLGLGKQLMEESIKQVNNLFGNVSIKIGAQNHLQSFYRSLGFVPSSEVYLEDGIDHIEMIRNA